MLRAFFTFFIHFGSNGGQDDATNLSSPSRGGGGHTHPPAAFASDANVLVRDAGADPRVLRADARARASRRATVAPSGGRRAAPTRRRTSVAILFPVLLRRRP